MKLNSHLLYNLSRMAPVGLYKTEQPLTNDLAQLPLEVTVPDETTMLFIALGDLGDGVQVLDVVPIDTNSLDGKQLTINSESTEPIQVYANEALGALVQQLNTGINNNPGLAPTSNFEYNEYVCQWAALSIKHLI